MMLRKKTAFAACTLVAASAFSMRDAAADEQILRNRTLGFVLTQRHFATWMSPDGKTECPQGFNHGPREQFKALYPNGGSFAETQLEREGEIYFPEITAEPELFFHEAVGNVGVGLNLDGKTDGDDYTSPEGERGIDNQMYRTVGCTEGYRGAKGIHLVGIQVYMEKFSYNRWLLELTNVDDLTNDREIQVTIYRGLDGLTQDAAGNFTSGGTQRVDRRWGQEFVYRTSGQIEAGVLTTVPIDITYPESMQRGFPYQTVRGWRLRLNLLAESAEGLMGGYLDLERWYHNIGQNRATHHQSYGAEPMPSIYRALRRNADAFPDPKTGINTHISAAWSVRFVQAFILHPPNDVVRHDRTDLPEKTFTEE